MDQNVLVDRVRAAQAGSLRDFSALVIQFQDMAVGYGQVLVKDFHLAEDAAQDAFVQAFTHLKQLEKPQAFPGWFRQIVFSCCMKVNRTRKQAFVPLDLLDNLADGKPLPDALFEQRERSQLLNDALALLSEKERTAVMLYYIREHTQKEMAAFLEVSVTTIKKRLESARQKLHRRLLTMVRQNVEKGAPSQDKTFERNVLASVEAAQHDSTIVGAMHGMLNATGEEWSVARVSATFGHAFNFGMNEGGKDVWQYALLDWDVVFGLWTRIGYRLNEFQAVLGRPKKYDVPTDEELRKLKDDTWKAVCESIDKGVPAMAWSPLSVEQAKNKLPASEWGLLVGYNEKDRTYTVRHQHCGNKEFEVKYDAFGYTDGAKWYCVHVLGEPNGVDRETVTIAILRDAVAFAHGIRDQRESRAYQTRAMGFEAYQLWLDALKNGSASVEHARGHARALRGLRRNAAEFMRECVDFMDDTVGKHLDQAAVCYDREVEALDVLYGHCQEVFENECFSVVQQKESVAALSEALDADKAAVGHIEVANDMIGDVEFPKGIDPAYLKGK